MAERIAQWLREWAGEEIAIVSECTQLKPGCMGVYRKGIVCRQEYPDGTREETHRYGLEICLWAQGQKDREALTERIEGLEDWIRGKDVAGELPELGGDCWRAQLSDGFRLKKGDALESVYAAALDLYVTAE